MLRAWAILKFTVISHQIETQKWPDEKILGPLQDIMRRLYATNDRDVVESQEIVSIADN